MRSIALVLVSWGACGGAPPPSPPAATSPAPVDRTPTQIQASQVEAEVIAGQPTVQGELSAAQIRGVVVQHLDELRACYVPRLLATPGLEGLVQTQIFIRPDGSVGRAAAAGLDPEVATCVAKLLEGLEFPRPRTGGVQLNVPFTFRARSGATGGDRHEPR